MKILHVTDSHGTMKSPESRKDIYYIAFLRKLYELGLVVKKENINVVVHTGDLFHTPRVSNKFAGQVSEMIKDMGIPFYVVPGNHDIEGYNIDTIDQTMLGLLSKTGVITILDRSHPVTLDVHEDGESYTVALSGQEYYANIDRGNPQDFEMQQCEADINILGYHGYLSNIDQPPGIIYTPTNSVITDADIILSGHYHRQFEAVVGDVSIYNPGSMMRVDQTDYNRTHTPQYGILHISVDDNIGLQYEYTFHKFKCAVPSETVFDYSGKGQDKQFKISLDGFKNSIINSMSSIQTGTDVLKSIQDIINTFDPQDVLLQDVGKSAISAYQSAYTVMSRNDVVSQGYVPDTNYKSIVRVTIDGFQSHKNTDIVFNNTSGLTVISGESNNGKTSIFRAIMWAIDNYPLGNAFITAGEKVCNVTIYFSDGSSITRVRSINDTGSYIVDNPVNGMPVLKTYKGFTNCIPVEVENTHQMPKIPVTRDIPTHLNVMSQLDPPFLISESPQNKAAAIGNITGTNIADTAIRALKASIRTGKFICDESDKKIIKKQSELDALPSVELLDEASNVSSKIEGFIRCSEKFINDETSHYNNLQSLDQEIQKEDANASKYKSLLVLNPIIELADEYRIQTATCLTYIEQNNALLEETDKCNALLRQHQFMSTVKQASEYAADQLQSLQKLSNILSAYNICTQNIAKETDTIQLIQGYLTLSNSITNYISTITSFVKTLMHPMSQLNDVDNEIEKGKKSLSSIKKLLRNANAELEWQRNDRINFILKNGICPCCGQPVETEEQAEHIGHFMEET